MKNFGEKNLDLLQNIEFSIIEVYRADRTLLDYDVKDALDALVRYYHYLEDNRTPSLPKLADRAQGVFVSVHETCEWRLGRALPSEGEELVEPIPVSELVSALRQVQKSVPRWSKQGGRQGYLDFVSQYLP
jgi:hypothetical protein